MPLTIFTQTITWIAGFSNYVFSMMFTTMVICVDLNVLKGRSIKNAKHLLIYSIAVLSGQLFVETATIYAVAFSVVMIIIDYILNRKADRTIIIQLVMSILGAVLMFSNSSYLSALTHDGQTYKSIALLGGMRNIIYSALKVYRDTISLKWFGTNTILKMVLTILVVLLSCRWHQQHHGKLFAGIGSAFLAVFIYDLVDGEKAIINTPTIRSVLSVLFVLYIAASVVALINDKNEKMKVLALLLSSIIMLAPLTVVYPVHDRCFLNTYVLEALIAAELFRLFIKEKEMKDNRTFSEIFIKAAGIFIALYLVCALQGQMLSWKIEELRMAAVRECKETGAAELIIPRVPDAAIYCYGANLSGNDTPAKETWLNNYKDFYGIDSSVKLRFADYEDYIN